MVLGAHMFFFFDILHNERGREADENHIKVAHVVNLKLVFTD